MTAAERHRILIEPDREGLARRGVSLFAQSARAAIKSRGRFMVALSGGSTPGDMHRMLAREPHVSTLPWDRIHLFCVDERCVPVHDPASNYGRARRDFLDRIPVSSSRVHPMPGHLPPETGALQYRKVLSTCFELGKNEFPLFDLIFLGMGKDGHTASLFPGHPALQEKKEAVLAVRGGQPNVPRLTLTIPVLIRAAKIVFMIRGRNKAHTLKTVIRDREAHLPAQLIRPRMGSLIWLLDREAASRLEKGNRP